MSAIPTAPDPTGSGPDGPVGSGPRGSIDLAGATESDDRVCAADPTVPGAPGAPGAPNGPRDRARQAHASGPDRVRESYDRVADRYVELGVGDLTAEPWLRAALVAFAEQVRNRGPVLDVGCGQGTVSDHLAGLGVQIRGIDLSPRMVAHARHRFPALQFDVGSASDLGVEDGSLAGILGWWSLFHLPRPELPAVLVGFARALAPGGLALFGFHAGAGDLHRTEAYRGVPVDWVTHLWQPEDLTGLLTEAGLTVAAEQRLPASSPQTYPQVVIAARRGHRP